MSTIVDLTWFQQLVVGGSPAAVVGVMCVVAALGIALGALRVRGVALGFAGVLFVGIAYAHLFWNDEFIANWWIRAHEGGAAGGAVASAIEPIRQARRETLGLLRDFGLILFVYSVGMQIGPNFFASLRAQGVRWNLLAVANATMGFFAAWIVLRAGRMPPALVVGMFSGAVTNTPSLAAAQQTLRSMPGIGLADGNAPGIGYAVAYPFGVLGTILTMLLVRVLFRVRVADEAKTCKQTSYGHVSGASSVGLVLRNLAQAATRLRDLFNPPAEPLLAGRVVRSPGAFSAPIEPDPPRGSAHFALSREQDSPDAPVAEACETRHCSKRAMTKRLVVTEPAVVGKTLARLDFRRHFGVEITRVVRADVETEPSPMYDLHFGDTLVAVGGDEALRAVEAVVGNSPKKLEATPLAPMCIAIVAGVLLGSIPWYISSLPVPVRLGLAGGPLIAALFFSSIGHIGRLSFYLPRSVNTMLREFGLVLFLSAVGLMAGGQFVETLRHGNGWYWMAAGAFITLLPLVTVALFARTVLNVNYVSLCGILAGSMTDAPALAFASSMARSDGPAIAYGTVYPVTQILRVLSAQLFVILFAAPPF